MGERKMHLCAYSSWRIPRTEHWQRACDVRDQIFETQRLHMIGRLMYVANVCSSSLYVNLRSFRIRSFCHHNNQAGGFHPSSDSMHTYRRVGIGIIVFSSSFFFFFWQVACWWCFVASDPLDIRARPWVSRSLVTQHFGFKRNSIWKRFRIKFPACRCLHGWKCPSILETLLKLGASYNMENKLNTSFHHVFSMSLQQKVSMYTKWFHWSLKWRQKVSMYTKWFHWSLEWQQKVSMYIKWFH